MKPRTTIVIAAAAITAVSATATAGTIHYSWTADMDTASIGDTVTLAIHATITPSPGFAGLAVGMFDVVLADMPGGGALSNAAPLGLRPDFLAGHQGTVTATGITGSQAAQMPPMFGPINTGTQLELYRMSYTVMDDTPRNVMFGLGLVTSQVYTGPTSSAVYGHMSDSFMLQVTQVPTPGAIAMLAAAGLVGASRRRKMVSA